MRATAQKKQTERHCIRADCLIEHGFHTTTRLHSVLARLPGSQILSSDFRENRHHLCACPMLRHAGSAAAAEEAVGALCDELYRWARWQATVPTLQSCNKS